MKSVLPDKFDLSKLEAVGDVNRQDHTLASHFILTRRARTKPAKQGREMTGLMAIGP